MLGTMINMVFGDKLGRKKAIAIGSFISILGCALQGGAVNMGMLIAGRFIAGAAIGMLTSTIPMYAAELSEPQHRGLLSGLLQWFLSWGFLVAQWLGYGSGFVNGSFQCKIDYLAVSFDFHADQYFRAIPPFRPSHSSHHSCRWYLVSPRVSSLVDRTRPL